jgi:hypothetical protein
LQASPLAVWPAPSRSAASGMAAACGGHVLTAAESRGRNPHNLFADFRNAAQQPPRGVTGKGASLILRVGLARRLYAFGPNEAEGKTARREPCPPAAGDILSRRAGRRLLRPWGAASLTLTRSTGSVPASRDSTRGYMPRPHWGRS